MMIGKAAPQLCARSSSATQSATCKIGPLGVTEFRLSCRVEPLAASDAATSARTATGRMCRMRDSISRRGEGMGSLECRRAAPQWRRFRQGSIPEDASGPRNLTSTNTCTGILSYHNYSDYSNYYLLQGRQA